MVGATLASNDRHCDARQTPVAGITSCSHRSTLQSGGRRMRIQVKGRNLHVSDDVREHVAKRFGKISKQVSELAELEVELFQERNPANPDSKVAEATLHLKGVTLRAKDASGDLMHSINLCAEELAVQVTRHRDKRRKRRESRRPRSCLGTYRPRPDVAPEGGAAGRYLPDHRAGRRRPRATLAPCRSW